MAASFELFGCDRLHAMKLTVERFGSPQSVASPSGKRSISNAPSAGPAWATTLYCGAAGWLCASFWGLALQVIFHGAILGLLRFSFIGIPAGLCIAGLLILFKNRPISLAISLAVFAALACQMAHESDLNHFYSGFPYLLFLILAVPTVTFVS